MRRHFLKKLFKKKSHDEKPDYIIMISAAILVVLGLFILSSASSIYSYQKFHNVYYLVMHQIIYGLLPGLVALFFFYKIDYHKWEKFYLIFIIISLGLLLLVFVPGLGAHYDRAQSWVKIAGLSFQPTEIVKLTFLIFLAGWFQKIGYFQARSFFRGFLPFLMILGAVVLLIAKQPDIGTMMIVLFIGVTIYFVAGAKFAHLGIMAAGGSLALAILVAKVPYLTKRMIVFLHPESDTQGIGYQIDQALLAIGSGGFFGRGFTKSQQKFAYLPEVSGDSIFAIAAEEFGFMVTSLIIIIFLVFVYRAIRVAAKAPDPYGRLLASGIISWLAFQTFLNIGVMVGIMPLTGVPLPFISYGGTALAVSLGALGLLLNISKQIVND